MEKVRERNLKSFYEDKRKHGFRVQIEFLMDRLNDHRKLLKLCKQKEKEKEEEEVLSSEEDNAGILGDVALSFAGIVRDDDHATGVIQGTGTGTGSGKEEDVEMAPPFCVRDKGPYWFIQERSVYEDKDVFAKAQFHSGTMNTEELQAYETVWDTVVPGEAPHDFLVYLKTDPAICMERITSRGGDSKGIDLSYLQTLEMEYKDWVNKAITKRMVVFRVDWTKQSNDLERDIKTTWRLITKTWLDILSQRTTYKAPYPIIDIPFPSPSSS